MKGIIRSHKSKHNKPESESMKYMKTTSSKFWSM